MIIVLDTKDGLFRVTIYGFHILCILCVGKISGIEQGLKTIW